MLPISPRAGRPRLSVCRDQGTTSSNIVIRKLETVDPLLSPQFLADLAPPSLLCYHFALAFSHCLAAREKPVIVPHQGFQGGVTAVGLIRAEQLSWNPVRLFCSPFSDYLHYSEIISNEQHTTSICDELQQSA